MVELADHQLQALEKLKNGSILCGGVGTGKSRTALAYYFLKVCKGTLNVNGHGTLSKMKEPRDLYIITTAKKRDSLEWSLEADPFCLGTTGKNINNVTMVVDSWNNIKKYTKVYGAFFIFDEQRVVGSGAWVKAFYQIAKKNQWILLSATPGDTWSDYIPVFVANGFYRNRTEFLARHAVYSRYAKYQKIERYVDIGVLSYFRSQILVTMEMLKLAKKHQITIPVEYNKASYQMIFRERWNIYDNEPIEETGKLFYLMRRVVNSDPSRSSEILKLISKHPKTIIFYNFTYELEILRTLINGTGRAIAEWNGEKHEAIPKADSWCYLVQYAAGCEGWNCIETNVIIFYSLNYSYKTTHQAEGRIDRMNTEFKDLYYYYLKSYAPIDIAIERALNSKKNFNERAFLKK